MILPPALAPYALALKIGLLAVLLLASLRAGCSLQADRDAKTIAGKDAALLKASVELNAAGNALKAIDANTATEIAKAAQQAAIAKSEAAKAEKDAAVFRGLLTEIERDIQRAKKGSAECRRELEAKPCAQLH